METKALAKKETTALVTQNWGPTGASKEDILVQKIILTQTNSKAAMHSDVPAGSIVKFPGNQVIGGKDKPIEFIPFMTFNTNIVEENVSGSKWDWRRDEDYVYGAPESFTENGRAHRRTKCINFYGMLKEDTSIFPVLVPFSKSALRVGKELINHFFTMEKMKKPPAMFHFLMSTKLVTSDKGSWFVPVLTRGEPSTEEEILECWKWLTVLKNVNIGETSDQVGLD